MTSMTSLGIALGLLLAWALGLALAGAYWIKKERLLAADREGDSKQRKFAFAEHSEYTPLVGTHSKRR
jgi:hypothetical protein